MTSAAERGIVERRVQRAGLEIALDLGPQRLYLSEPSLHEHGLRLPRAMAGSPLRVDPALVPSATPRHENGFVSAASLALKAKQVDDRVIAAAKLLLLRGAGRTPGRRYLLARWAAHLFAGSHDVSGDAVEVLLAACRLGKIESPRVSRALDGAIKARIRGFLATPQLSLPLGFHGDTEELTDSFRQNRMLATAVSSPHALAAVVGALHRDQALRAAYEAQMQVRCRITNPPKRAGFGELLAALDEGRPLPRGDYAIFPPLVSPEAVVIGEMAREEIRRQEREEDNKDEDDDEPEGRRRRGSASLEVLDAVIHRLRKGTLSLAPTADSGFYQYQWWAAEPLAVPDKVPEAARLGLDRYVREHWEHLFRAAVAFARETHVEDLEEEEEEAEEDEVKYLEIHIHPHLTVEPVPTHYIRRALGYRFLRRVLERAFGSAVDEAPQGVPGWPRGRSIREELDGMADVLVGAAVTSWRELGRAPAKIARAEERAALFEAWRARRQRDPDLGADARMMVPVSVSPNGAVRVWMFLGWREIPVSVSFARRPRPRFVGPAPARRVRWVFGSRVVLLDSPIVVEGYVRRLLDRRAFRAVCARERTVGSILHAVGFEGKLPG